MSRFVGKDLIRITLDDDAVPPLDEAQKDVVWIRPKMNYGADQRVKAAMFRMAKIQGGRQSTDLEMDLAASNIALLVENIVRWAGPGFEGVPVSKAAIEQIDPTDPLLERVLTEINTRNKRIAEVTTGDDEAPNLPTPVGTNGSTSDGGIN